jgi:hypothetical protein
VQGADRPDGLKRNTLPEVSDDAIEQAVFDCMKPTQALYERTDDSLPKAILLNFWRHVHLWRRGALRRDREAGHDGRSPGLSRELGDKPAVVEGKDGVLAFYNSVGETVLWHSDDRLAVNDWGICDEITFHQLARGAGLKALGYQSREDEGLYHVSSRRPSSALRWQRPSGR